MRKHTAYLLSYSVIEDDPRVRRLGDALQNAGWKVIGIGLSGAIAAAPTWPIVHVDIEAAQPETERSRDGRYPATRVVQSIIAGILRTTRTVIRLTCPQRANFLTGVINATERTNLPLHAFFSKLRKSVTRRIFETLLPAPQRREVKYWRSAPHLESYKSCIAKFHEVGAWIANDWIMLPIANLGSQQSGGKIFYDSHELATEQFSENAAWLRYTKPIVETIESKYIKSADVISTVSASIGNHLEKSIS